jgi:N-acetylated-alpha-linked acidic dipeptidase
MKKKWTLLSLMISCIGGTLSAQTLSGFTGNSSADQLIAEKKFDNSLDTGTIDLFIKEMSAHPHHVGSPGDKNLSEFIYNKYKSWGFDVRIETFYVLFPTPKSRLLEMESPTSYKAILMEIPLKEDATSGQTNEQLPTYNCYSPDGDVTGGLVFVNYGLPEDYEYLDRLGINVKGKIVIAKYGKSWRGIKPKVAQEHGAIGCLIYSDPMDDGYFQGDVYPKGAYKSEYGVQRGSVMDMPIYPGDPLTPGVGAVKEAKRIDRKDAANLLKIPVLPISYHDATPLLQSLDGPVAPSPWRGALPFTYHIGTGKTKVHLKLEFNWDIKPVNDVIAMLKGSSYPDEWVVRGNHYDAWVNGANDPLSGQAAMLDEASAIGGLARTGWKPKRTIVYCSWDGEEPALLGSTEWVEQHAAELQQKVVTYINSDDNGRGFLHVEGSHALEPFVNEVARDVMDPETGISVLARNRSAGFIRAGDDTKKINEEMKNKEMHIGGLGSGSDYSPFIQHIGVPSLDIGFGGEDGGGEYHSIYDSYDDYRRFKDPTFEYELALAKTAGRATLRLADAEALPFDFRALSKTIDEYLKQILDFSDQLRERTAVENKLIEEKDYEYAGDPKLSLSAPPIKQEVPFLNFASLQNVLSEFKKTTIDLWQLLQNTKFSASLQDTVNKKLFMAEQKLLLSNGLPRRSWYRHSIYAPGFYTGYGVKTLPGIREAIEQRNWKEAQEQIELAAGAIQELNSFLSTLIKQIQ